MRKQFKNGCMRLTLIAQKGFDAVFARLNSDGTIHDFIYAWLVEFYGKDGVSWGNGTYDLTKEQALDILERS